jgi:hypothetical protein
MDYILRWLQEKKQYIQYTAFVLLILYCTAFYSATKISIVPTYVPYTNVYVILHIKKINYNNCYNFV